MIGDDQFDLAIKPSDVALLVALPTTWESFEADVEDAHTGPLRARGDFAASQLFGSRPEQSEVRAAWDTFASETIPLLKDLISDAQNMGVYCEETTTGLTLSHVMGKSGIRVIILIAHWKSAEIRERDLCRAPASAFAELIQRNDAHAEYLRQLTKDLLGDSYDICNVRPRRVAQILNYLTNNFAGSDQWIYRNASELAAPIEVLELRDGYYTAEAAGRLVPSTWQGILDLEVCTSISLAESLKQNRNDRRVLTNQRTKYVIRSIPEVHETLLRLHNQPQPFIPLRARVHRQYNDVIQKEYTP